MRTYQEAGDFASVKSRGAIKRLKRKATNKARNKTRPTAITPLPKDLSFLPAIMVSSFGIASEVFSTKEASMLQKVYCGKQMKIRCAT